MKGKNMIKRRLGFVLCALCGWAAASISGTPQQVYAQTRTTLASLQAAIDSIIAGTTPVGMSNGLTLPTGFPPSPAVGQVAWSGTNLAVYDGVQWGSGPVRLTNVSDAASAANAGTLRWTGTQVQFCDGSQWVPLN